MVYGLAAELVGHTGDVKAVTPLPTQHLSFATSSRDCTVKVWSRSEREPSLLAFDCVETLQHKKYVNAIAPIDLDGRTLLASGGLEGIVFIWNGSTCVMNLTGHEKNVCALRCCPQRSRLFSGSWDGTARVWQRDTQISLLSHGAPVWDIAAITPDCVVTACADKALRLYDIRAGVDPVKHVENAHADRLRTVEVASNAGLFTGANDGSVAVWSPDLLKVTEQRVHKSIVYRARGDGGGSIVLSSEDGTACVCDQYLSSREYIQHASTVWDACAFSGVLVTAGSDGITRVWSQDEDKQRPELHEAFSRSIEKARQEAMEAMKFGGKKVMDLPTKGDLARVLGKEGETKVVNNEGRAEAYEFKAGSWELIGEVMPDGGDAEQGGQVADDGAFECKVDIEEGKPPLTLRHPKGGDPAATAEDFVARNGLNPSYVQQIIDFINQHTAPLGEGGATDPLTGGSSYRPGGNQTTTSVSHTTPLDRSKNDASTSVKYEVFRAFSSKQIQGIGKKIGTVIQGKPFAALINATISEIERGGVESITDAEKDLPSCLQRLIVEAPSDVAWVAFDLLRLCLSKESVALLSFSAVNKMLSRLPECMEAHKVTATMALRVLCNATASVDL
uniref:PFU domain-containing protein n=1 Tax=Palpitomonas bilix TaxID=652834 RepID=A0A7S3CVC5_9EUKA|mmetsp:Transcript_10656/g.27896  ORF Transcript_10656/g.27896 Transcript_10656/m.27896 type:complete len:618 (+) Transcript_10656:95-1948(+)